jgi:hypothetical protein
MILIFNGLGLAFIGIGLAVSILVGNAIGISGEGPQMLLLGPVVALSDLAYRLMHKNGHWFWPSCGGQLFCLPVWFFGVLWVVFGLVDTFRGASAETVGSPSPAG